MNPNYQQTSEFPHIPMWQFPQQSTQGQQILIFSGTISMTLPLPLPPSPPVQTPASTATPVAPTAPLNTADRVVSWDKVLRSDSSMDIGNSMHIVSPDDIQRSLRLLAYEMLQQVPATSAPVQDANLHQQPAFNGLPAFSTSVAPSSAYGCPSSDGYLGLNRPDSCSSFDDFFDFLSATESEIDSSELSSPGPETSFPANPVVFADRGNYSSQAAYQGSTPSPLLSSTSSYVRANTAKKSAAEKPRNKACEKVASGASTSRVEKRRVSKLRHCEICNKQFTRPSSLRTHMLSHTGEKPHACDYPGCTSRFSVSSNLARHKKSHSNN